MKARVHGGFGGEPPPPGPPKSPSRIGKTASARMGTTEPTMIDASGVMRLSSHEMVTVTWSPHSWFPSALSPFPSEKTGS